MFSPTEVNVYSFYTKQGTHLGHRGLALTLNLSLKEIKATSKLSAFPNKTGDSSTSRFSDKQ